MSNVGQYRKNKGWTQEQFAEMLGMSLSYVKKVESNRICPSVPALRKMSSLLGASTIDELIADMVT